MKKPVLTKRICTLMLFLIITGSISTIHAQDAWEQLTSMPEATTGAQSVLIDSLIYVFGGFDGNFPVKTTAVYNIESDEWGQAKDVPVDIAWSNVGLINDKAYMAGGWLFPVSWITTDALYIYDFGADEWGSGTKCPKKAGSYGSCVFDEKLHLFGGTRDNLGNDLSGQGDAYVYDPGTDTWDTLPDMNHARGNASIACVYNDQIYLFGGFYMASMNQIYSVKIPERYDPTEKKWTDLAEIPQPGASFVPVVYNDKIYLFGAEKTFNGAPANTIQEYDPVTDTWQLMESMPFIRCDMRAHKSENYFYLIGGASASGLVVTDEVWRFNLDSLKPGCQEVTIREFEDTIVVGDSVRIYVDVLPSDFANKSVDWSSDNGSIATVSEKISVSGTIHYHLKGLSEGTATITAKLKYGGCSDSHKVTVVPFPNDIKEMKEKLMSIYPNPARDFITIQMNSEGKYTIEIASLNGRIIHSAVLDGSEYRADLSSFKKGFYLVTVRSEDITMTGKIIKL